jgi:uncharacterized membrane protein (DUF485 family)
MPITLDALTSSPEYKELIATRTRIIWPLLVLTVAAYVGFILLTAFLPATLAKTVGGGVVSVGILLGLGLILFNFVITLIYVYRANRDIEPLVASVHALAGEK